MNSDCRLSLFQSVDRARNHGRANHENELGETGVCERDEGKLGERRKENHSPPRLELLSLARLGTVDRLLCSPARLSREGLQGSLLIKNTTFSFIKFGPQIYSSFPLRLFSPLAMS